MSTATMPRTSLGSREERLPKRKKDQRTDIWTSLLRQTREAQARNRTQTVQHRQLLVCGGSPEDQKTFLQSLSRPPPTQHSSRTSDRRQQLLRGQWKLSNRYAYGYGHVTLFSPPQQSTTGLQALGSEPEEVASLEVHTISDPAPQYVVLLRRILAAKENLSDAENDMAQQDDSEDHISLSRNRPQGICILLSWKEPWKFMSTLRRWIQILAEALLPPDKVPSDPLDIMKDAQLGLTVVVQHTESQENLLREGYKEEDFDYISQCLRTVLLPLHPLSALAYMSSATAPQPPGSRLSETQKLVYASLDLDLSTLSPRPSSQAGESLKKDDMAPKHEFMDRMAIVIPSGWDSAAFVRTLSENFQPEEFLNAWLTDLQPIVKPNLQQSAQDDADKTNEIQQENDANGNAEVYANSPIEESVDGSFQEPTSPSKTPYSALRTYANKIQDPQAHKAPRAPQIEVTTKPDQNFLADMKAHLQDLEAQDRERDAKRGASTVSNTGLSGSRTVSAAREQSGALNELGDVSFNVGGVSYDTVSAEAAIERLKRPQPDLNSPEPGSRNSTPRPHRPTRDPGGKGADGTPNASTPSGISSLIAPGSASSNATKSSEDTSLQLKMYFDSLMNKQGGPLGSSRDNTPSKSR